MGDTMVYFAGLFVALSCMGVAIFQVFLALGYPLGEFANGGAYKILPKSLRIVSIINVFILLFVALVFLQHTNVLIGFDLLPTKVLVWVFTVFLGVNTVANLLSRSKKERNTMTPISGITFLLALLVALS